MEKQDENHRHVPATKRAALQAQPMPLAVIGWRSNREDFPAQTIQQRRCRTRRQGGRGRLRRMISWYLIMHMVGIDEAMMAHELPIKCAGNIFTHLATSSPCAAARPALLPRDPTCRSHLAVCDSRTRDGGENENAIRRMCRAV